MWPTRFPYGQAKGFVNNFQYRGTTAGLFAEADTTPDVTTGDLFYANNTTATVITHFDLQDYVNRSVNYEGKVITVFLLNTATQLANGGRLFLVGSDDLAGTNHSITLMHSRSGWYELRRAKVNQNGGFETSSAMAGSSALVTTKDSQNIFINGTASPVIIAGISGNNYIGQRLTLIANSQGLNIQIKSDAALAIAGTNAIVYTSPRTFELIRVAGSWLLTQPYIS